MKIKNDVVTATYRQISVIKHHIGLVIGAIMQTNVLQQLPEI